MIGRRRFLGLLAGASVASLAGPRAFAIGPRGRFRIARALYQGGNSEPHPDALRRLAWEIILRTSVDADYDFPAVRLDDPALFATPLVYLSGDRGFNPWSEAEVANFRRYLTLGGLALVDDAAGRPASDFNLSIRREAARLFPNAPLARLPDEHSIFRSYYLLRRVGGRVLVSPYLEGVQLPAHSPILYCRNDLGGAWARDALGRWSADCVPGGESQRQAAFQLGVNVALYALTLDYKQDQVHLPFIRERLR